MYAIEDITKLPEEAITYVKHTLKFDSLQTRVYTSRIFFCTGQAFLYVVVSRSTVKRGCDPDQCETKSHTINWGPSSIQP